MPAASVPIFDPSHVVCDRRYPYWQSPPHRSFIRSVRFVRSCHGFVIQPSSFVLPEGYNLTEIGVNEQELRKKTDLGVWVQLVRHEDDELHIRIEDPDEYPYQDMDEDFSGDVSATEENYHGDGVTEECDDSHSQEGDEYMLDIACCLSDTKIPQQDLLDNGRVYQL